MEEDQPHLAAADAQVEPKGNTNLRPELPRPHGNTKHGLGSKGPIVRALLPEDEAEAWDRAPVPFGCSGAVEETIRECYVKLYRFRKWEQDRATEADASSLHTRVHLLGKLLKELLKALELHSRMKQAEHVEDRTVAYLRTLPDHQVQETIFAGEAPRFHPTTGKLMPNAHRELD